MTLSWGSPEQAGVSASGIDHVKRLCATWVDEGSHKALCVLVARRGVVCLHEAYGRLGPGESPPLERDSIFPVLSISKSITATVLMQLVEEGVVGLTRPVQEYIPDFVGDGKPLVCVHHLLTHTSGIGGGSPPDDAQAADPPIDSEIDEWVLGVARTGLGYEPGTEMRYSGANYMLIGEVIRRATGSTVADVAAKRIFQPLGMAGSSYGLPDALRDRAIGWNAAPGLMDTSSAEFRSAPTPHVGVHSTAADLAVFGQMFLDGGRCGDVRVLQPSTVAAMTRDQIPGVGATFSIGGYQRHFSQASWGYGWGIAGDQKWPRWPIFPRGSFSHSGGGGALLWVDPSNDLVGVYLSICRFSRETHDALTNNDLFVNAIVASVR